MKYVKTNIGLIPMEEFLDIKASQLGYDDYEDMKKDGYSLTVSEKDIVEKKNISPVDAAIQAAQEKKNMDTKTENKDKSKDKER